ncbi:cytochrome P450 [Nocardioides daejeonensis]|uniref:cytochrome P450 n=1 Tax=Nocardioides daejeonensis TaxID=1046556 RepID=UPI00194F31C6|nr:cytochrome P450 [Nocardioides daejeonensis]
MTSTLAFDPYDYGFQADPYPTYAQLREHAPLHHNTALDLWAITRHADVTAALRDDARFSNAMGVSLDASAWRPDAYKVMSFLAMDAPRQTRLRKLVSRGFTPKRVQELTPRIEQLTAHYFDASLDGELDWITDVAGRLPMDVISEMMGVPAADRDEIRRLADLVVHREEGVRDVPVAGMEASLHLVAYYAEMVAERRVRPVDDLTSALCQAEVDGDKLEDEEIIAFLFLMVVAGNETTTKLLGNAVFHLTQRPEQFAAVFDPARDLVNVWIEETLRFDTSSQMLARHLLTDYEIDGVVAPAGSKVMLVLGSANRDERVFTRADAYDIHRDKDELTQIASFGGGRHYCLGANLARLEARIVLHELVRRVSDIEVDHERCVRVHSTNVRGFASVPMKVALRERVRA